MNDQLERLREVVTRLDSSGWGNDPADERAVISVIEALLDVAIAAEGVVATQERCVVHPVLSMAVDAAHAAIESALPEVE